MTELDCWLAEVLSEAEPARQRVMAWWREDCGWGKDLPKRPLPALRDGPGPLDPVGDLSVTPAPTSNCARYIPPEGLHKCATEDCDTLVGPHRRRCQPCVTAQKSRRFTDPRPIQNCVGFDDENGNHPCGRPTGREANAIRCAVCRTRQRLAAERKRRLEARRNVSPALLDVIRAMMTPEATG